jgi:ABC-2 type transport system permease protein
VCSLASALTKNQVISFVVSVLICVTLLFLGWSVFSPVLGAVLPVRLVDILSNFSFITHFNPFMKGLVDLKDVTFFVSLIGFSLCINVVALER